MYMICMYVMYVYTCKYVAHSNSVYKYHSSDDKS